MPILNRRRVLWSPEQYRGGREVVTVAQPPHPRAGSKSERDRLLRDWIAFFSAGPTRIRRLTLSWAPQRLLDSLAGQTQLESLTVRSGGYTELGALSGLTELRTLVLAGATKVSDASPLLALGGLTDLTIDEAFAMDPSPLGRLVSLTRLSFGNSYPGNDKSVVVPDLGWVRSLTALRVLRMPGTRLVDPDLSVLLELPELVELFVPLRRAYRKQVFELAENSPVFAKLAREYEGLDRMRAKTAV